MYEFIKRYKILVLVTLMIIIALQVLLFAQLKIINDSLFEQKIEQYVEDTQVNIQQSIHEKQKASTAIALAFAELAAIDSFNLQSVGDDLHFNELIKRINEHSSYNNLWLQVVDLNGQSLYRNWSSIRHDLLNIRPEFSLIKQSEEPIKSVSSGKFDLTIKVVIPILVEGHLLGFIDLITHFNSIQKRFETLGVDSLVVATKERSKLITHPFSSHTIGDYYLALLNPNLNLVNQVSQEELERWIERSQNWSIWNDKLVVKQSLMTPDDQVHGYYFAFIDLSKLDSAHLETHDLLTSKAYLIIADVVFSLFLLAGLLLFLLRSQKQYFQNILNSEEEIVLVTNGQKLIDANTQLYRYFTDIGKNRENCICDYFINEPGFLQKDMNGVSWVMYLINHPEIEHKVMVKVKDQSLIFRLKARRLSQSEDLFVVVLVDITALVELNEKLNQKTLTDSLTKAGNRRYFNQYLAEQLAHVKRYDRPLAVILFDIDYFKRVNDTYGHQAGDEVLVGMSRIVFQQLREVDKFFRIGGEEFMIVFSGHTQQEAYEIAERIRQAVEGYVFTGVGQVTISLGVTQYQPKETDNQIMQRVDRALYRAKEKGRNQTEIG